MCVALQAEICRLAEIDERSGRVITRRLHCSRHSIAAAMKLQQPPLQTTAPRASLVAVESVEFVDAPGPSSPASRLSQRLSHWLVTPRERCSVTARACSGAAG